MVAAAILKNRVYKLKAMFARSPPRCFMKVRNSVTLINNTIFWPSNCNQGSMTEPGLKYCVAYMSVTLEMLFCRHFGDPGKVVLQTFW